MRIVKVGAGILGVLLLGYLGIVASALWTFRTHTYTIPSAPGALWDDAAALHLADSALRLHGADPSAYTPGPYSSGVAVGHNTLNSNRVTTYWVPHSATAPGLCVDLEQHGPNVVCYITRSK
jgi:hypothetical protein